MFMNADLFFQAIGFKAFDGFESYGIWFWRFFLITHVPAKSHLISLSHITCHLCGV